MNYILQADNKDSAKINFLLMEMIRNFRVLEPLLCNMKQIIEIYYTNIEL